MSRVDYSSGAEVVAIIRIDKDEWEYVFDAQAEDTISNFLAEKIGDRLHELNGCPLFMEASSWCVMAGIGETYEDEEFEIYIMDWSAENEE